MNTNEWADDYRPQAKDSPFTLIVEGEVFTVTVRENGSEDYTWESGPNKNYGFGGGPAQVASVPGFDVPDGEVPDAEPYLSTVDDHRRSIRNFLGMIDPETGYIE